MNSWIESFLLEAQKIVAKDLLGKILVRRLGQKILAGKIVETEAYFGKEDPASRAYRSKGSLARMLYQTPGRVLVYGVHGQWLFNIIAHEKSKGGAVLIRALEPLKGIDTNPRTCKGPGKLSNTFRITKAQHGLDVCNPKAEILVAKAEEEKFKIIAAHRVGVTKDLPQRLRFYIEGNKCVSKL